MSARNPLAPLAAAGRRGVRLRRPLTLPFGECTGLAILVWYVQGYLSSSSSSSSSSSCFTRHFANAVVPGRPGALSCCAWRRLAVATLRASITDARARLQRQACRAAQETHRATGALRSPPRPLSRRRVGWVPVHPSVVRLPQSVFPPQLITAQRLA